MGISGREESTSMPVVTPVADRLQLQCRERATASERVGSPRAKPLGFDQSSSGLRRCLAVYLPTLRPSAAPTSVLLRQCIPPHTRALPSSAWTSATLV